MTSLFTQYARELSLLCSKAMVSLAKLDVALDAALWLDAARALRLHESWADVDGQLLEVRRKLDEIERAAKEMAQQKEGMEVR